jgi:arsenite methyltransferase
MVTNDHSDIWTNWLRHDRYGGDADNEAHIRGKVLGYADRILNVVEFRQGMTLVDLGTGEGLVAFRALERFGASLNVIMTDISRPLLNLAEAQARAKKLSSQCMFLIASADQLSPLPDQAADVVTARSVLAYVENKLSAFSEIYRVLKPGGRLSIAEPIFRDEALAVIAMKRVINRRTTDRVEPLLPLLHRWKAAQFPDEEDALARTAITNYTERDLVRFAQKSGFTDIHLELHIDVHTSAPTPWETFVDKSPHPLAPTLRSVLREKFSAQEQELFEEIMRPRIETGGNVSFERMIYLTAIKPFK